MSDILSYLSRYASVPLSEMPFTEVDNLILSRLAYGKIEETSVKFPATCRDKASELLPAFRGQDEALFTLFASSRRFGNTILFSPASEWAEEETLQFAAVTFLLPDNTAYVAYRGTDNTLVGWKEDFNLSFISPIPAQTKAKEYLDLIGRALGCPLRVGGHSKGGNLAVYAASYACETVQALITDIYNNDGPGHDEKTVSSDGYRQISGKIRTYLPKSSIVGMLLEHSRNFYIVDSDARGLFQHNPYTWLVDDNAFQYVHSTTLFSMHLSSTIRDWLKGLSNEERKRVVDIIFDVLEAGNVKTVRELKSNAGVAVKVLLAAADLKAEDRKLLIELVLEFLRASYANFEKITVLAKQNLMDYAGDAKSLIPVKNDDRLTQEKDENT